MIFAPFFGGSISRGSGASLPRTCLGRLHFLDADTGGLLVTHLTDHDHIRVGPQKRPHGSGKVESDFRLGLHDKYWLLRSLAGFSTTVDNVVPSYLNSIRYNRCRVSYWKRYWISNNHSYDCRIPSMPSVWQMKLVVLLIPRGCSIRSG